MEKEMTIKNAKVVKRYPIGLFGDITFTRLSWYFCPRPLCE
jgi:hypothetical protein